MAKALRCSIPTIVRVRDGMDKSGTEQSSLRCGERERLITDCMRDRLREYLSENSDRYLEEMRALLFEEFDVLVSISTISRSLRSMRWSKKVNHRRAKEQNPDLRDFYLYKISQLRSWQLVFIDETGCDRLVGFRKKGWDPRGVTPVQVARFHRGKRYQILPAYCQDGVMLAKIFPGTTNSTLFEDFIEQLLPRCGRWLEPRSVLIMDNASIHHSGRVKRMCEEVGVILIYLPPYSPDLNPIEEFFAELKGFMTKYWSTCTDLSDEGFAAFLR